jgi:hypothetical protein
MGFIHTRDKLAMTAPTDWTGQSCSKCLHTEHGDNFFDAIYAPNAGDYNSVGQRSLGGLANILELLAEGQSPLYADSVEILEHDSFSWEHPLPGEYGSTTRVDDVSGPQPVTAARRETTHLDAYDAMLDIPMEMDLNSMTTCKC